MIFLSLNSNNLRLNCQINWRYQVEYFHPKRNRQFHFSKPLKRQMDDYNKSPKLSNSMLTRFFRFKRNFMQLKELMSLQLKCCG